MMKKLRQINITISESQLVIMVNVQFNNQEELNSTINVNIGAHTLTCDIIMKCSCNKISLKALTHSFPMYPFSTPENIRKL